ncbi:MAG TPA: LptA/OstA family protein, partial [Thermoanaerobaculia bacterium]|nr:LptA/OstA family protein [Thermoanaerobaculia bacterium]
SVTAGGETLKAKTIAFAPRAGTAKATGDVIAQLTAKDSGPSAASTGLFPGGKPVFVNSDSVSMRQSAKTAVFTGHVRAWQDTNTLFAEELQVEGMGDQIGARGSVRTLLYNMAPSEKANGPMQTQSDALTAFKTEGRVDLIGNVKIDDGDRHMTGEKASFFFSPNHQMQRIEAQNHIVLLEPALGRKATGDKAVYDVARRVIRMTGSPVTVTDPKQSLSGEQIAIDLNRNKVEVISPTAATQGTYKPQ